MIVIAMIILALLTIIGISATNISITEVQVSTNAMLHNIAFYAADSGIEVARPSIQSKLRMPPTGTTCCRSTSSPGTVNRLIRWTKCWMPRGDARSVGRLLPWRWKITTMWTELF